MASKKLVLKSNAGIQQLDFRTPLQNNFIVFENNSDCGAINF